MFWDNTEELITKKSARLHMPPPVPETNWTVPTEPPNLSSATVISFDTETKDTKLLSEGPGWARGKSHIIGVSLGAVDRAGNRGAWYFPLRHELEPYDNLPPDRVLPWLDNVLNTPNVDKVGANLTYDIGNLICEGVRVAGTLHDVQFAEALIDNDALVELGVLGYKYVNQGKTIDVVKEWIQDAYPNTNKSAWKSDLYRTPPRLVGPYAIDDANLPLDIITKQYPILEAEKLLDVYRLECDLIPLMVEMRLAGITVDVAKAERLIEELEADAKKLYAKVYHDYGVNIQSTGPTDLAKLFDHVGIEYARTPSGQPSFTKEWLATQENPVAKVINDIREHEKMISTFLKGYIINKNVNGKIYPTFHQLANDANGTKVGRFASSDPNLQNIPARSKLGKKVRTCFTHDEGHAQWMKLDQSQIHYRILAHYAVGPGADELRASYVNNPDMDYHWNVYTRVAPIMNWTLDDDELNEFRRRPIKNINFGLLYGQSEKSLKYKTASYFGEGFGDKEAAEFFNAYFVGAPYVKPTMQHIGREVQTFGYVETLLGRRIRFALFEPAGKRQRGEYFEPLPYEQAIRTYGAPLKLAYEYRGVNYKFQGSEPDIIKKGMLDCYKAGVFNVTGVPRVTVHDECDWSIPFYDDKMREAIDYVKYRMTNCIPMRVPLKVDEESGLNWGELVKVK